MSLLCQLNYSDLVNNLLTKAYCPQLCGSPFNRLCFRCVILCCHNVTELIFDTIFSIDDDDEVSHPFHGLLYYMLYKMVIWKIYREQTLVRSIDVSMYHGLHFMQTYTLSLDAIDLRDYAVWHQDKTYRWHNACPLCLLHPNWVIPTNHISKSFL